LSVSVFEKTEVSSAFALEDNTIEDPHERNQLNLFTF